LSVSEAAGSCDSGDHGKERKNSTTIQHAKPQAVSQGSAKTAKSEETVKKIEIAPIGVARCLPKTICRRLWTLIVILIVIHGTVTLICPNVKPDSSGTVALIVCKFGGLTHF
jgi:hypothetical protein